MSLWLRSGIFRRILLYIVAVSLIPLIVLGWVIVRSANEMGDRAISSTSKALDSKSAATLEYRARETARSIATFLYEREGDIRALALVPRNPNDYLSFFQIRQKEIWYQVQGKEVREMAPLYREVAFINNDGQELIKIADGKVALPHELRDVGNPRNTTYKSETYFLEARQLTPGRIYVSHVTGFYVNKIDVDSGKQFIGLIRFAMPVFNTDGKVEGVLTLALDSRHIEEFTIHVLPTENRSVLAPDASSGNYAYICDDQGFLIAHPLDYHQRGLDTDGNPVSFANNPEELGALPLRLDQLGFADEGIPYVHEMSTKGSSGSVRYLWEGVDKFVAFAPIPYYGSNYLRPGGFGWVGIGANTATFHEAATTANVVMTENLQTLTSRVFAVFFLVGMAVLIMAGMLARQFSGPIRQLTEMAGALEKGSLEAQHLNSLKVRTGDELGNLAGVFKNMATQLQESMAGLARELTERKRAEEALRESEDRYRRLVEQSPDAIGVINDQRVLFINPAGVRLLGAKHPSEITANPLSEYLPPEKVKYALDRIRWATSTGSSFPPGEGKIKRLDGTYIDIETTATPLTFQGKPALQIVARDIKDRKQVEEQLIRAQRLEMAGRIAGQVAHDFNNLLSPMTSYPDLIKMELPDGHSAIEYCDAMLKAAQQMADINEDLLALSRRVHVNQEPTDINQIVQQAIDQIPDYPKNINLELSLGKEQLMVKGSVTQLLRVVSNLLTNGIDAIQESGTLLVTTDKISSQESFGQFSRVMPGEYVHISVRDTGAGISSEIAEKIFEPFFTTKKATSRRGSGLGLSIVAAIVGDHQGYVDVESEIGKGTCFHVYLPVSKEESPLVQHEVLGKGSERILVVDDDALQREVASHLLGSRGYSVTTVESGEKAVEHLRQNAADLVILDMIMPGGMDGLQTYRRILTVKPGQKAIIVSGYAESDSVKEAQALGVGAYLRKPVTLQKLLQAVRTELERGTP